MAKFEVMLAQPTKAGKVDFNTKKYYIQPKLDGIRCYITADGMFTRNHKPILSAPHIYEALEPFFEEYGNAVILDGELYNHDLKNDFDKIISLVRKTKPTKEDLIESAKMVEFHCYDMFPSLDPQGLVHSERMEFITREVISQMYGVVPVETIPVYNNEDVTRFEELFLKQGYEGAMVREDAVYEQKRSWTLQKVKRFTDAEATVVGFVEGKGKLQGKLGKFLMQFPNGKEFGAPASGHTHAQRQELWENRESLLGTEWTVEFFEYTKSGAPRFPILKAQRNYE